MNNGLSGKLKAAFPNTIPESRPIVGSQEIKHPNWLAGFTSVIIREGLRSCLFIDIKKGKGSTKTGFIVRLKLRITQNNRDSEFMKSLVNYLACGWIEFDSGNSTVDFSDARLSEIIHIIPFFNKYNVINKKVDDFNDWCIVAKIKLDKAHLIDEGLEEIRLIKGKMNRGRSLS